jgi:hypothetical protein
MALVVENDFWIRLVLCDVLAQAGYRVAEAWLQRAPAVGDTAFSE